jgi:hypothetical protein
MKNLLLICLLVFSSCSQSVPTSSKNSCINEQYLNIQKSLKLAIGEKGYKDFVRDAENRFSFQIIADEKANIIELSKYRVFKGLTDAEFSLFYQYFKSFKYCIYNPEAELNFEDYVKTNKGKLTYSYLITPKTLENLDSNK